MIKYDDLENAFLFVSAGYGEDNEAVINKKTGETYYHSSFTDEDDFPEDVESDDYVYVPHKNDLDLGRKLVNDFVQQKMPENFDQVQNMFQGAGAYGRFKDFLMSMGKLDDWHKFEDEQTKKALLGWCEENGLEVVE